jgi:hypothetical protein
VGAHRAQLGGMVLIACKRSQQQPYLSLHASVLLGKKCIACCNCSCAAIGGRQVVGPDLIIGVQHRLDCPPHRAAHCNTKTSHLYQAFQRQAYAATQDTGLARGRPSTHQSLRTRARTPARLPARCISSRHQHELFHGHSHSASMHSMHHQYARPRRLLIASTSSQFGIGMSLAESRCRNE